jgi:hypothetical protein
MAHVDPRLIRAVSSPARFELKIHEVAPEDIEPNGDRYTVEVIDLDEKIEFGSLLVVTQEIQQKDEYGRPIHAGHPQADPSIERRGVIAAVVVLAGNGHLLGLSDLAPVEVRANPGEWAIGPSGRPWASVPMFYEPGDVVLIDHTAKGRALKIVGRECRIVGQIDILARILGVRLRRTDDGGWEREE